MSGTLQLFYNTVFQRWKDIDDFLKDQFFRFLFFDPYLLDSNGSGFFYIAHQFSKYLTRNNDFLQSVPRIASNPVLPLYQNLFGNSFYEPRNSSVFFTQSDEYSRASYFMRDLKSRTHMILLSGYESDTGGHAIVLYIQYTPESSRVYVINSGDGLEHHSVSYDATTKLQPIVILYNNVTDVELINLYRMYLFFKQTYTGRDEAIALWKSGSLTKEMGILILDGKVAAGNYFVEETRHLLVPFSDFFIEQVNPVILDQGYTMGSDLFYKVLHHILKKPFLPIAMDFPQMSGSCSFYSIYYFIKYFIFQVPSTKSIVSYDSIAFNRFIRDVKERESNLFFTTIFTKSATSNCFQRQTILNVAHMLLKDHVPANSYYVVQYLYDLYGTPSLTIGDDTITKETKQKSKFAEQVACFQEFCEKPDKKIEDLNHIFDVIKLNTHEDNYDSEMRPTQRFVRELMIMKCLKLLYDSILPTKEITTDTFFSEDPDFLTIRKVSHSFFGQKSINMMIIQCFLKSYKIEECPELPLEEPVQIYSKTYYETIDVSNNKHHIKDLFQKVYELNKDSFDMYTINYKKVFLDMYKIRNVSFKRKLIKNEEKPEGMFGFLKDIFQEIEPVGDIRGRARVIFKKEEKEKKEKNESSLFDISFGGFTLGQHNHNEDRGSWGAAFSKLGHMEDNEKTNPALYNGYRLEYIIQHINNSTVRNLVDVKSSRGRTLTTMAIMEKSITEYLFDEFNFIANNRTQYQVQSHTPADVLQIIETIDIDKFLEQLPQIPINIVDYLLFCMYIFRSKYEKLHDLFENHSDTILRVLQPGSFFNHILKKDFYDAFAISNIIFKHLFITTSKEDDYLFLNKLIFLESNVKIPSGFRIERGDKFVMDDSNELLLFRTIEAPYTLHFKSPTGTLQPLLEEGTKIGRRLGGEEAWLEADTKTDAKAKAEAEAEADAKIIPSSLTLAIRKLDVCNISFLSLKNENNLYLSLNQYDMYFRYNTASSTLFLYVGVGVGEAEYEVIVEKGFHPLLGIWVHSTTNALILKKGTRYYVLFFMSRSFLYSKNCKYKDAEEKPIHYWNKSQIHTDILMKQKNNYHIIPLHHTLTSLDTHEYNELYSAYLTYNKANNLMALNLLMPTLHTIVFSAQKSSSLYKTTDGRQYTDTPLWPLFIKDKARADYFQRIRPHSETVYSIPFIAENPEYKKLTSLFVAFQEAKAVLNDSNLNSAANANLIGFLKEFRYACSDGTAVSEQVRELTVPFIPFDKVSDRIIFQNCLWRNNKITSGASILSDNFAAFYQNLLRIVYNTISEKVLRLTEEELSCEGHACGVVLKLLQPLDPETILPLTEARTTEEVLFELQKGLFLRKAQKDILQKIYASLSSSTTDAYEILMGAGKTSTITPLTILHQYFSTKTEQFIVCLPSHLVEQSYRILLDLVSLVDVPILKIKEDGSLPTTPCIAVISVDTFKKNMLDQIRGNRPFGLEPSNLVLFDEVDSLLNPLKSDLNMPSNISEHPHLHIITSICIEIMEKVYSSTSVEDSPDYNLRIKHPKTMALLYGGTHEPAFATVLERKLTTTLQQVLEFQYNQTYGFGMLPYTIESLLTMKELFVAIPYTANLAPSHGSEFTDFELSVLLTISSYHESSIRKECIYFIMKVIYNLMKQFDYLKQIDSTIETTIMNTYFTIVGELISKANILSILALMQSNREEQAMNLCEDIAIALEDKKGNEGKNLNKHKFIKLFLQTIVFKYFFKITTEQYNISCVDLFHPSISHKKISFSGTVNFNIPADIVTTIIQGSSSTPREFYNGQIEKLYDDKEVGVAIKASFFGKTTHAPTLFSYEFTNAKSVEETFLSMLLGRLADPATRYHALIDTAGLILFATPLQVIQAVRTVLPDTMLLYIENGVRKVYQDKGNASLVYQDTQTPTDIFIYYDNKNCVGADFKQPHGMRGLVTISEKNNLTEISQGIYRLRNINIGHYVDFYLPATYTSSQAEHLATPTECRALYQRLLQKDIQFKEEVLSTAKVQVAKYVHRIVSEQSIDSYGESIFFDTIQLDKTSQTFIDSLLDTYTIAMQKKTQYSPFSFTHIDLISSNLSQKQNIAVQQEVQLQVNQNIVKKIIVNRVVPQYKYLEVPSDKLTALDYCRIETKYSTQFINNQGSPVPGTLLQVSCSDGTTWNLFLSLMLIRSIYENFNKKQNNYIIGTNESPYFMNYGIYAMIDVSKGPMIQLISYLELYSIRNNIKRDPSLCLANVSIFDPQGHVCVGPAIENPFPPEIKVLLYTQSMSPIHVFHSLTLLYSRNKDAEEKINFFRDVLQVPNQLTLRTPQGWAFDATTQWSTFSNWETLFGFYIDPTVNESFRVLLQDKFFTLYRTTFPEAIEAVNSPSSNGAVMNMSSIVGNSVRKRKSRIQKTRRRNYR